jgi:hypothetical protein
MDPELVTRVHGGTHGHLASRAASAAKVPSVCICVHLWLKFLAFLRTAYCPPIKLRLPSGMLPTRTRDLAAARTARRAAKQERFYADAGRWTRNTRMGRQKPPDRIPGRNADAVALVPSACSACICLHLRKTFLAWQRAARRRKRGDGGRYAPAKTPCTRATGSLTPGWCRSIGATGNTPCTRATPH